MSLGKRETERQHEFWLETNRLATGPGHVFYDQHHRLLSDSGFDRFVEQTCQPYYKTGGRPSIPPERLLKAQLLVALYSVRSDRMLCEMLDYNILFRWFLDMSLEEPVFDPSTFSKNRDRLLAHDVSGQFFDAVVRLAQKKSLLSDEHFTVDGTLKSSPSETAKPNDA